MQPFNLELIASAAYTATQSCPVQTNPGFAGVLVILNVTAASGTGGLEVQLRFNEPITGSTKLITGIPQPVTATGTYVYAFYPEAGDENCDYHFSAPIRLPSSWSVTVTHGDGSSYTYSLGASYVA